MQTYNSQNLPLEHIVKSGRNILHYKFVIKNTQAKPANRSSSNPIDHWNDDDPSTRTLDETLIDAIIKKVNELGIPANIDISFENKFGITPSPMNIFVLPTAIEIQKDKPNFIAEYIYSHDEHFAKAQAAELKRSGLKLGILQDLKVKLVKEQIRRTLIYQYLLEQTKIQNNPNTTNPLKWLEGLNIINNHYDLAGMASRKVHLKKTDSIVPRDKSLATENLVYADAIREFSKNLQLSGDDAIYLFSTPGVNVIGLNRGTTASKIDYNADFDKHLMLHIAEQTQLSSIVNEYMRKVPKPLPPQYTGN